ncbi:MAG: DUF3810 family protein [Bacteroidota bacterium]
MDSPNKHQIKGIGNLDKRFTWIGLGLFTMFITFLLGLNPTFTEVVYSRGLFALIRWVWDYTLGWIPFPLIYLLLGGLIYWVVSGLIASRKKRSIQPFRNQMAGYLFSLLAFISGVYMFFQFMWGFNYQRLPVERSMGLEVAWPDSAELIAEFQLVTEEIIEMRNRNPQFQEADFAFEEAYLRGLLATTLNKYGYSAPGRPRGKLVSPKGSLMHWGALGIYLPFISEGSVDAGLPTLTQPFTLIHEMSHGYGFGDEGTANFWAYLSCIESEEESLQYVGKLTYWRHLARLVYYDYPDQYTDIRHLITPEIKSDLELIRNTYDKYPAYFPELYSKIYDRYLKAQGIEEGIKSYSRVVALIIAWQEKEQASDQTQ